MTGRVAAGNFCLVDSAVSSVQCKRNPTSEAIKRLSQKRWENAAAVGIQERHKFNYAHFTALKMKMDMARAEAPRSLDSLRSYFHDESPVGHKGGGRALIRSSLLRRQKPFRAQNDIANAPGAKHLL